MNGEPRLKRSYAREVQYKSLKPVEVSHSQYLDSIQQQKSNLQKSFEQQKYTQKYQDLSSSISKVSLQKESPPKQPQPKSSHTSRSLKLPLSPQVTLQQFHSLLTLYERTEILEWPEIYFAGSATVEKVGSAKRSIGADLHELYNVSGTMADHDGQIYNHGYDDSRGDLYLTRHDHIGYRYEILSLLGKGSFGQVIKCYDHKLKMNVAVKVIRNKKRFEKQGLVEVHVLNRLTAEDKDNKYNLVHCLDNFYFRGHLCFSFELLGINIYEWLKAGSFRGVHLGVVKTFGNQILQCLSLLEKLKIIHCDLKPENVLIRDSRISRPSHLDANLGNSGSSRSIISSHIPPDFNPKQPIYDIRVIDFGSSCYEHERLYTYVQSRFYRSPEVILGIPYSVSIDMWSFGCMLAELFTGYPLFPGENEAEQLACIMEIKGIPDVTLLSRGSRSRTFFDSSHQPRAITNSKGKKRRPGSKTLSGVVRCTDMAFLDFLERCLTWDPKERMTPGEAILHPFITNQRFIPKSVNLFKPKPKEEVLDSKPGLVRNKYASTALINNSVTKPPEAPSKRDVLKTRGSLGSLNSRLPSVTSITRLGSQISNAVGLSRNRASNPSVPQETTTALPPISYSMYLDPPVSKPKTSNSFVSRLNKIFQMQKRKSQNSDQSSKKVKFQEPEDEDIDLTLALLEQEFQAEQQVKDMEQQDVSNTVTEPIEITDQKKQESNESKKLFERDQIKWEEDQKKLELVQKLEMLKRRIPTTKEKLQIVKKPKKAKIIRPFQDSDED